MSDFKDKCGNVLTGGVKRSAATISGPIRCFASLFLD